MMCRRMVVIVVMRIIVETQTRIFSIVAEIRVWQMRVLPMESFTVLKSSRETWTSVGDKRRTENERLQLITSQ